MDSPLLLYITLISVSGVFNFFLGLYAYMKRTEFSGAKIFLIYAGSVSIYCFAYAFSLASDTLLQVKYWTIVQYIGMPFAAPLSLLIVRHYIGHRISRRTIVTTVAIPVITFFMVATNDWHHLQYKTFVISPDRPLPYVEIEIGFWYIVHGIYTFSCLLASTVLLISNWRQTSKAYRLHLIVLICGQLVPMVTAFLYLIGVTPAGLDPVPLVICFTSALYIWAILTTRMLTVIPIAKETIFDNIGEGVIVLDLTNRIIDYNRVIREMLPAAQTNMIGKPLQQMAEEFNGHPYSEMRYDAETSEVVLNVHEQERIYQVRMSDLKRESGEVVGRLLMLIDVTVLKRLQQELEQQAFYDGLTQILNRTQFILRSRELLAKASAQSQPFTIAMLDIDYFKRVNDSFGHEAGDHLLIHTVNLCKQILAPDMLFARYGGEEFVIAMPGLTLSQGIEVTEKLRATIAETPFQIHKGTLAITASLGIAQTSSNEETLELLLNRADEALYRAKRNGRNQVCVHLNGEAEVAAGAAE